MATTNHKKKTEKGSAAERTNGESLRWALGLTLFFLGVYALCSSLFYLGDWQADYSVLHKIGSDNPRFDDQVENLCGYAGAWLAEQLIGRSFGLFGLIIPVMVMVMGLRVIRRRPLVLNHSLLSALMVLILGSLTLGYAFGKGWNMFNSGWGGAYGIELSQLLHGAIGAFGTIILLVVCWILTGVFINRNFINTVNSAGSAVVDRGEKIMGSLRRKGHAELPEDESAPLSSTPESASPSQQEPPVVLQQPAQAPISEPLASEPDPFREVDLPSVQETLERRASQPVVLPTREEMEHMHTTERPGTMDDLEAELRRMEQQPARRTLVAGEEEDPFSEVPLGDSPEQELSAPAQPNPAPWVLPEADNEDPFVEIDLAAPREIPTEEPAPAEAPIVAVSPAPSDPEQGIVITVEMPENKVLDEGEIEQDLYDPLKDLVYYAKPSPGLLENYPSTGKVTEEEIFQKKCRIEETLKNFGIPIKSIHATSGPTVTLYEIRQAEGVKISKIQGLENDIAQSIEARGIRIIAPIPGKGTIGIEVPNEHKQIVPMYSSICSPEFQNAKMALPVVIGRTIQNENFVFDLAKAPHLLVAGATGQGKSVGLNAIITSLLYTKHPAELKFVMIDPKMVEFSLYAGLEKHFLAKMESEEEAIITDPKKAVYTLHALEQEMEERLQLCKKAGAKNIVEYNQKFVSRRLPPPKGHRFLPYIVVVIDEFADLIMTAKEVERPVMRLAQKARAVGIHLIIATQRPDVRVITGGIKANFPARIAFRVMQMVDSRTIIDQPGAQSLIGRGDMLFTNGGELTRIQCALVDTPEVERIVEYIASQQGYPSAYPLPDYTPEGADGGLGSEAMESGKAIKYDALFAEIARSAVEQGSISTSMIQRNYEVGFNRAGRIMMQLQAAGIVGPQMGAKPRDILFHDLPSLEAKLQDLGVF